MSLKYWLKVKGIENDTIQELGYGCTTVSYSRSIATLAILEIFSVKEWPDLEISVWGRSRSLKMVPFDKRYTSFYWSAIVTIALSCSIFELFDLE